MKSALKQFLNLSIFIGALISSSVGHADFHEVTRFKLGGEGGWDYLTLDSNARRLYVARANRIMIIDVDSGKLLGEVTGLDGAHGVALVQKIGVGFATSGKSAEVIAFDLKNFKVLDRIKVSEGPDSIAYNATSNRIVSFNGKSQSASVIDPATRKVLGSIALAGKPESAVSDDSSRIFVGLEDKNLLLEIDPIALKVMATYPLGACEEPTGISMDLKSRRVIVGCGNKTAVIVDASSGKVLQAFKVGDGVDAVAFDPQRKLAHVSAGEGQLTILFENKSAFNLLQNVTTQKRAHTVAVDEKTGRVFLPVAKFAPAVGGARPAVIPGTFEVLVVGKD